jgi:hypothetical protein
MFTLKECPIEEKDLSGRVVPRGELYNSEENVSIHTQLFSLEAFLTLECLQFDSDLSQS